MLLVKQKDAVQRHRYRHTFVYSVSVSVSDPDEGAEDQSGGCTPLNR